jgi:anti-sigma B factor antagonist
MKINYRQQDQVQVFEVDGELDFHTSPQLREKLLTALEKRSEKILISLKKVRYIDSSGLATFVEALQKIKRYQGKLVISEIEPQVKSIFEIAKLDSIFAFAGSLQEAISMLNRSEPAS